MQILLQFSNQEELIKEILKIARGVFKNFTREEFMDIVQKEIERKWATIDATFNSALKAVVAQRLSYNNMYFEVEDMIKQWIKDQVTKQIKQQMWPAIKEITRELITKQAEKILKIK